MTHERLIPIQSGLTHTKAIPLNRNMEGNKEPEVKRDEIIAPKGRPQKEIRSGPRKIEDAAQETLDTLAGMVSPEDRERLERLRQSLINQEEESPPENSEATPQLSTRGRALVENLKNPRIQSAQEKTDYIQGVLLENGFSQEEINARPLSELLGELSQRAEEAPPVQVATGGGGDRQPPEPPAPPATPEPEDDEEFEDKGIPREAFEWIDNSGVVDSDIQKLLQDLKGRSLLRSGQISSGYIDEMMKTLDQIISEKNIDPADNTIRNVYRKLNDLLAFRRQQERPSRRGSGEESESPYDPPKSIEELIEENIKYAPIEYREGREKALLYEKTIIVDGKEIKVNRVNFENLTRYIHELVITRGAVSPRSPVNYFSVLKFRRGFNQYTLEDLLLYDETATLFLPRREGSESEEEFQARIKAYRMVRDNLSGDLWVRQNSREKHTTLEYSGAVGSDTKYPEEILKTFNDNVPIRSEDFENHLNLSTALSFSPGAMEERVRLLMERENTADEGRKREIDRMLDDLNDKIDGQIYRQGVSAYAHINDFNSLTKILGKDSVFFHQSLSRIPQEFVKNTKQLQLLESRYFNPEWFMDGVLDSDKLLDASDTKSKKRSVKSAFINLINIFNAAAKPITVIEAVQERLMCALAEKAYVKLESRYRDELTRRVLEKNPNRNEDEVSREVTKELWKNAFEAARYDHEDSYYWTSIGGLNTGDNDPTAQAFRAKSKPDSMFAYFNKQLDLDRGQFPGNQYLMAGVTRLSTSMVNAIRTINGRSILDVMEGRVAGGDTAVYDFDGKAEEVTFANNVMSFHAENHVRRVFKLFNEIVEAKELGFNAFVTRDQNPLGQGRLIIDKAKAQEVFAKWKDWRYIFNEIPMEQRIRAIAGQDENGNYLYKEMTIAEAFFSKELLHDYLYEGKAPKEVNGMIVKKGDVDPEKILSGRRLIWKAFTKYFVAAELYSHRQTKDPNAFFNARDIDQIIGFLQSVPSGAVYGGDEEDISERNMEETGITDYFLSPEEIKWVRKISKTGAWRVGGEEFLHYGSAGLAEGGWKLLLLVIGASSK